MWVRCHSHICPVDGGIAVPERKLLPNLILELGPRSGCHLLLSIGRQTGQTAQNYAVERSAVSNPDSVPQFSDLAHATSSLWTSVASSKKWGFPKSRIPCPHFQTPTLRKPEAIHNSLGSKTWNKLTWSYVFSYLGWTVLHFAAKGLLCLTTRCLPPAHWGFAIIKGIMQN